MSIFFILMTWLHFIGMTDIFDIHVMRNILIEHRVDISIKIWMMFSLLANMLRIGNLKYSSIFTLEFLITHLIGHHIKFGNENWLSHQYVNILTLNQVLMKLLLLVKNVLKTQRCFKTYILIQCLTRLLERFVSLCLTVIALECFASHKVLPLLWDFSCLETMLY